MKRAVVGARSAPSALATIACVVVLVALLGHDIRPIVDARHDHGSALASLCFVLVGLAIPLLVPAPPHEGTRGVRVLGLTLPHASPDPRPREASARASPAWLQRFKN